MVVEKEYLRYDTLCHFDEEVEICGEWFTLEFLNDIKCMPNHCLKLKVGVPIMLQKHWSSKGIEKWQKVTCGCLGKQYIITTTFITRKNIGDTIFILRMDMVTSDLEFSLKFIIRTLICLKIFYLLLLYNDNQRVKDNLYLKLDYTYITISRVK